MKRILTIILLLFALLVALILTSHYFPEKVPKKIATAIPEKYYKVIPRQVRDYLTWLKPSTPEQPMTFSQEDIDKAIGKFQAQENAKNKPTQLGESLQETIDDFYQKLAEAQFQQAYAILATSSQAKLNPANFQGYYNLVKDTFNVNKSEVDKKSIISIANFKDPSSHKVITPLYKAKVTFQATDKFSAVKSISEVTTKYIYFTKENNTWKIVDLELSDKGIDNTLYYYYLDEGYKRLTNKDYFGAIDLFRQSTKVNSMSINANYGLSVAMYSIAYYDKAVETVQKMEFMYKKKYSSKLKTTEKVDIKTLKKLDAQRLSNGYYIMALSLIKTNNLAGAKDALQRSLTLTPKNNYTIALLRTIPSNIKAKPARYIYKYVAAQEDPFKKFRESTLKEKKNAPAGRTVITDTKKALELLQQK